MRIHKQTETIESYATHGNLGWLVQFSLSWIQMSQRTTGAQKIILLRVMGQIPVQNASEALKQLIDLRGSGRIQAQVRAVKLSEMA